ncbi:MAG TPA: PhoH family protein [Bacillota bacterium]|nr:PhoH family protein [Bacillota bacterium]HQI17131.1 PhoH family protein [Bacillota bacterium]HQJ38003.1 PhoH family protein [Bacillota bacterium]HRS21886.1 PhoH family protein [Clostridia bacterium]
MERIMNLFGNFDQNLKVIEDEFDIDIIVREGEIKIVGQENAVAMADRTLNILMEMQQNGEAVTSHSVSYTIELVKEGRENRREELDSVIITNARGKAIKSKTIGQKRYIDAIRSNEVVFGIGPAGTGKTYLAMAMAVKAFKSHEVSRIILTRPAVEAGEKLGFLPGDLQNKVDPYLRPLYDALHDIMGAETYQKHIERGVIEVAPLAYMRGRTLDDSYIILDEAQNTSPEQMKMFLTRLGFGSKAIITGDITQIDLPKGKYSGLKQVMEILRGIKGIGFVYFSEKDVVRHKLVKDIIKAYEKHEEEIGESE